MRLSSAFVALLASLLLAGAASAAPASYRGAFFYPWYPETATFRGRPVHFTPNLQPAWPYSSGDPAVIDREIASMRYARIQFGIYAWFGRGTRSDARLGVHLERAAANDPSADGFKWAIYYECEGDGGACSSTAGSPDPGSAQISSDLAYLRRAYGQSPSLLRVGGKPVVFVYNADDRTCGVARRWHRAAEAANWHVVLKVFAGYRRCASQPSGGWHQYGPASRESRQRDFSFSISPGFFKADERAPRLARRPAAWRADVRRMVASKAKWQLVTTWNEWGEGTAVESARQWSTASGRGVYADRLRVDGRAPGSAVRPACSDGLDNDFDGRQDYPADPSCASASGSSEAGAGPASLFPVAQHRRNLLRR